MTRTAAATIASVRARQDAAAVRADLEAGTITPTALLSSPGMTARRAAVGRVPVERLLRSVRGVGEATARRACQRARISSGARLASLTDVQLARLAEEVQGWDLSSYPGTGPRRSHAA